MLFRWKLITLGLAILCIVLLGVFSQLLKSINGLPDVQQDRSYIVPLLHLVNPQFLSTLTNANNMLAGITTTSDQDNEFF